MKKIDDVVKLLADEIDAETLEKRKHLMRYCYVPEPLVLFGDENSIFLKQVAKKAAKFNYPVVFNDFELLTNNECRGFIVDTETCERTPIMRALKNTDYYDADFMDIDRSIHNNGLSAVADAVWCLINELFGEVNGSDGLDITIVGRGDSVQDLAKRLVLDGATVTVAHSRTKDMMFATMDRDIVIYATPQLTDEIAYDTHELVIDLGNAVPNPELFNCNYVNKIGDLTTSILMSRLI